MIVLTSITSVLASSGFWAYLQRKDTRRDATTRLLMGLAYDQLTRLGLMYMHRGSITKDEFEDYRKYFFDPYKALGGNGVAERIMRDVSLLPFRDHLVHPEIFQNRTEGFIENVRLIQAPAE